MLRRRSDARQLAIVAIYFALLGSMHFATACRNPLFLAAACVMSFLTAVVNHNHLHHAVFRSRRANEGFALLLSFASLYPVSANVPAHNLVHHRFSDDGAPDWADPRCVRFRVNVFNLLHFPNVVGPVIFDGVTRWRALRGRADFRRRYLAQCIVAFGLTALLLAHDFWTALFYLVVPQLFGARWFVRINIIQHDGCDVSSEWNHSRNFVGRAFNYLMMNSGFHTAHHRRAGLHWSVLPHAHEAEVAPHVDPKLVQRSFFAYLARTYLLRVTRP